MRAISYWRPALGVLAVLAFALNVSAADRQITGKPQSIATPDNYGGGTLTPGPGNPLLSPANNCGAPHAGGVLPAAGGTLSGDTLLAGDDFSEVYPPYPAACGYSYGPSGSDEIWEFTVESAGRWTFDTCTIPAYYDTSIGLSYDIGIGCPGVGVVCNGDDACGSYWESAIRDVCLQAGPQIYWLIVDGWSPISGFPGTYYDVTYSMTTPPCFTNEDCSDGDACTGIEQCVDGCCEPGPPACPSWAYCNPVTQECENLQDPCTAALNHCNSLYTASQGCEEARRYSPGGECEWFWKCDDIETWWGAGDKLVSYKVLYQAREYASWEQCLEPEEEFPVQTAIFTNSTDGSCLPDTMIPGTLCDFTGVCTYAGDPPQEALCEPGDGMQSGIVLPNRSGDTDNCEIDFFVCIRSEGVSGFMITDDGCWAGDVMGDAIADEVVGGPAGADDWGFDVMFYEGNDPFEAPVTPESACRSGVFSPSWFGGVPPADFAELHVCVEPVGECCMASPDKGCMVVAEKDCTGTYRGDNVLDDKGNCNPALGDPDGDDIWFECDNCPDVANWDQADCNDDTEGDACDPDEGERDKDVDGCCDNADACPNDARKCVDEGQCGCGEDEIDSDGDGCMDCVDLCPNDPNKCDPGVCGCGSTHDDDKDNDGDGYENCIDECAGADDAVFAPGCMGAIPTVSEWGLVILALLLLAAGKVYFGHRKATA